MSATISKQLAEAVAKNIELQEGQQVLLTRAMAAETKVAELESAAEAHDGELAAARSERTEELAAAEQALADSKAEAEAHAGTLQAEIDEQAEAFVKQGKSLAAARTALAHPAYTDASARGEKPVDTGDSEEHAAVNAYEEYVNMPDGKAKTAYFRAHGAEIQAAANAMRGDVAPAQVIDSNAVTASDDDHQRMAEYEAATDSAARTRLYRAHGVAIQRAANASRQA